jgi:LPXTG-motif cell wall-anchored protein
MSFGPPLGIAILIVGIVLLGFGYHFSEAPLEQVSNALTGRFTANTMWYLIVGISMIGIGGFMTVFGRRA